MVDNPGVGENLQDHLVTGLVYEAMPGVPTVEDLKKPVVMELLISEYLKNPVGPLVNNLTSSTYMPYCDLLDDVSTLQETVEAKLPASHLSSNTGFAKQMKIHKKRLLSHVDCVAWLFPYPGGASFSKPDYGTGLWDYSDPDNYLAFAVSLTHPLSRGSIHIQSSNVNDHPSIDPRYLSHPADIDVLAKGLKLIDSKLAYTEPLASKLKDGPDGRKKLMPSYGSFSPDNVEEYVQKYSQTNWHILGTCSMLPQKDGGVVDPTLRVYGTKNLRVIDASIIPLQVQGNIQTAVYAVAEKSADLIKEAW
ncbi:hypothetical protein B7463_g4633, partial [Scytalidium lignicola]